MNRNLVRLYKRQVRRGKMTWEQVEQRTRLLRTTQTWYKSVWYQMFTWEKSHDGFWVCYLFTPGKNKGQGKVLFFTGEE